MKLLKIFSIVGLLLVVAIITLQIVFQLPMGAKFVASVCAVLGVVVAAQMIIKIEPQSFRSYKEKKAEL